jgi:MFS family permease
MQKKKKLFYGWWIVLVSSVLNFFIGGVFFYGFTVFFNPIRKTFGWSAAATSVAFIFQRLELGLLAPVAGLLVDRIGPRVMMIWGWIIIGLGYVLMSRIDSLWSFYGAFIIIAIGVSFGTFVVMNAAVANWFTRKRSRALSLIYVGFGASGVLVPLVGWLIHQFEWRTTLVIIGVGSWIICVPQCLTMAITPTRDTWSPCAFCCKARAFLFSPSSTAAGHG